MAQQKLGLKTHYCYDGDRVIAEYNDSYQISRRFIYGPGIDEPICMIVSGGTYWYYYDGLGSVIALVNSSGYIVETYNYDAFGNTEEASKVDQSKLATLGATIQPPEVISQAGWRLSYEADSVWHNASNSVVPFWWENIVPGTYTVYFKDVEGRMTPSPETFTIEENTTSSVGGIYQEL